MFVHSVVAGLLTVSLGTVPAGAPAPRPAAAPATGSVTLITGDRVTLTGDKVTAVHAAGGAHVSTIGGDTYVYPDEALRYVAAGLLDDDLFNITQLVADGYDDAHTDRLPLIVGYSGASGFLPRGAAKVRSLDSIGGAAVTAPRDGTRDFWNSLVGGGAQLRGGITHVWLDGKVHADLAESTAQIGAPQVWAGGDTGAGVPVAVLDTGVDAGHPDLAGRITQAQSFVPGEDVTDRHGHGTHVASTIAGTGAGSDGRERGVAPGADLRIGKVLDDTGSGQDSWIIGGMQWAARDAGAKVISMSLGGGPTDGTDPLSEAVNRLSAETGALFVIAAGNSGPDMEMVSTPGAADAALTVGAVDSADRLAVFSSRGPRQGDNAPKPDLTAPGVDILAARSQYAPEGSGLYQTMSGTSMATPHVAGAAALLAAVHPAWSGAQLKDALISTSKATPRYTPDYAGAGRVDAAGAVEGTVFATGSTFASLHYPYELGQKSEQTITYTNTGPQPVTLDLTVSDPGLALGQNQITVAAGATAAATVTAALDDLAAEDHVTATVSATIAGSATVLHTVVAWNKEGKRADLSVTARGLDGRALPGLLIVKDILQDTPPRAYEVGGDGKLTARLPASTYTMWMYADVPGVHGPHSLGRAVLVAPEVVLDTDRGVTLDGTKLRQVEAVTPQQVSMAELRVDLSRTYPDRFPFADDYYVGHEYDSVWATPTKKVTQGDFTFGTRWAAVQPPLTVAAAGRSYDDLLVQSGSGQLPDGVSRLGAVLIEPGGSFAPAAGKVAVVRYVDVDTAIAQADAAARAGAAMLLIVNSGAGKLDAWWEVGDPHTPLPVASIGRDQGERLIAAKPKTLTVESHPAPHYVYDLARWHRGAIGRDLTYRPRARELAKVEQNFRAPAPGTGGMSRADEVPDRPGTLLFGPRLAIPAQGERTDWVNSGGWLEMASVPGVMTMSRTHSYPAGRTSTASWFAPVARPRVFDNGIYAPPSRFGDQFALFTMPTGGDGDPQHQAFADVQSLRTTLYQGNTELGSSSDGGPLTVPIGLDAVALRMVTEVSQDGSVSPYSTQTRTQWSFTAPAPGDNTDGIPLDLLELDYQVPADLAGRAPRHTKVGVAATHLDGRPLAGTVRLEVSYDDGRTWRPAPAGTISAPASAQFASLRATATDRHGGAVTQTVIRAFGLR